MRLLLVLAIAAGAQASYERVVGYQPGSQVTDHCAIDLDQGAMEAALGLATPDYGAALAVYESGGHSKSYAALTLQSGLSGALSKGDPLSGTDLDGHPVSGKAYADYAAGATEIRFQYITSDFTTTGPGTSDANRHVGCFVGGLSSQTSPYVPVTGGCLGNPPFAITSPLGSLDVTAITHKNGRDLEGFSTAAQAKMYDDCPGCPYAEYKKFYDYYGDFKYADTWVRAALEGSATSFTNGNVDFSTSGANDDASRIQGAKKGSAYMNVWMYVVREFEDAIDDCKKDCIQCNDDPVHAWDEGVCFYTGGMVQPDTSADQVTGGKLLWTLADKRCSDYKTCGPAGNEASGQSKVNQDLAKEFALGQLELQLGQCDNVRPIVERATNLMRIPLIQGTMRYAYKVDKLGGLEKEKAEGYTFAAAVLPALHFCSAADATIVYDNMKQGATATDYAAVKEAFERNYPCLGITCADVGGLWNSGLVDYYDGAAPCVDASTSDDDDSLSAGGIAGIAIGAGIAALLIALVAYMAIREKRGKPVFAPFIEPKDAKGQVV